jgi:hypothetical protein
MPSRTRHGSRRPQRYKRSRSRRRKQNRPIALSTLSTRSSAARDRAVHVLAEMRNDSSLLLGQAARLHGVKPSTVKKYLGSALKKVRGRVQVTKSDRFRVTLFLPDAQGNSVAIRTRSSKERTEASLYLRDLGRALRGERDALASWRGKKIAGVELFTDESGLVSIEPALSEFSLYRVFNS